MRHVLLALQYFTRIPLPERVVAWVGYSPALMRGALAHLPGVGWVVGALSALVLVLAHALLGAADAASAMSVAVLAVGASVLITGAFHEDGLADVGDALGGFASREDALRIMKDSRLGSYGVITLVLALLLRICLLASFFLPGDVMLTVVALLSAQVLSRWAALFPGEWLPYVGGRAAPDPDADGAAESGRVPDDGMGSAGACSGDGSGRALSGDGDVSPGQLSGDDKGDCELPSAAVSGGCHSADGDGNDAGAMVSKSRPVMVGEGKTHTLLIGSFWALPALLLVGACFGAGSLVALLVAGAGVTWQLGRFFRRRLGGVTGDCLGATQQAVELCCLLVMLAGVRWG